MALYRFVTSRPRHGHGGWHFFKCLKCANTEFRKSFFFGAICAQCGAKAKPHGNPEKV